jgi:hypothetical protein
MARGQTNSATLLRTAVVPEPVRAVQTSPHTLADAHSVPRSARVKLLERITLERLQVAVERELVRRGRLAAEPKTWTHMTAAHARISRAEADGRESFSPEAQVDDLAEFFVDNCIWPTYLCFEVVSGWKRVRNKRVERPAFRALMGLIARGELEVQSVTSYHMDRVSRREGIGFEFLDLLLDKGVDLYMSSDREMRPLIEAYDDYADALRDARKQSDATSRRVKVGHRRLVKAHIPISGLQDAYGHIVVRQEKRDNRGVLVPKQVGAKVCEAEAAVVTEFKERVLATATESEDPEALEESAWAILAEFNGRGLRTRNGNPFKYSPFLRVVRSPRMCAMQRWNGKLHDMSPLPTGAGVEPLMTYDEWVRLCAALVGTRGRTGRKASYLLSGHANCGVCGATMSATTKSADAVPYYRCSSTANPVPGMPRDERRHPWIPVDQLDTIAMACSLLAVDAQAAVNVAEAALQTGNDDSEARKVELSSELAKETRKRKNVNAKHMDDEVDDDEFDRRIAAINARTRELTTELENLMRQERRPVAKLTPVDARRAMELGNNAERLDVIEQVLPSIRVLLTERADGGAANNVPPSERVEIGFAHGAEPHPDDLGELLDVIDERFAGEARARSAAPTVSEEDRTRIWEMWADDGLRMGQMLEALTAERRTPPDGGAWSDSTVRHIIKRECKTHGVEFTPRNRHRHPPELVDMTFELYSNGRSFEEVAADLAAMGFTNSYGNPVNRNNVWSAYRQACVERGITVRRTPGPKAGLPAAMQDRLLALHEAGKTQQELADWLNSKNVRTKRGNTWKTPSIHHQLVMARRRRDTRAGFDPMALLAEGA